MEVHYDPGLVALSVIVAMFASYTALVLVSSVTQAEGRARALWLAGGALAMGFGIWSMHFVGMLAFSMPGMTMAYDLPLMVLSILIAIGASAFALAVVSRKAGRTRAYPLAGVAMGVAIAGMHYTGMASMRMPARIEWNYWLVSLSVLIAIGASLAALWIGFRLRGLTGSRSHLGRVAGGVAMGVAIAGMHYTGMAAASFVHVHGDGSARSDVIATSGLTLLVVSTTVVILALALIGALVDRALSRRIAQAEESTRLFQDAKRALSALHEERELRERFVSSLTHDLRTPLTAARLSSQLIIRQTDSPQKVHQLIAKVLETLDRADQMIQDLLDVHRLSARQGLPLRLEECDVARIVRQSVEELALVYGDRFVIGGGAQVIAWCDPGYLRRLVENLGSNAAKYGEPGTRVSLFAEAVPGDRVRLRVHNEGKPLTAEERASLFHLFHRSRSAQMGGIKGWGIGLTLVKGVAEAHGGTVQVVSEAGKGTTFVVELPRDSRSVASP